MRITLDWLKSQGICAAHVPIFAAEWGTGDELTRAALTRAASLGLRIPWLAEKILGAGDLARFRAILDADTEQELRRVAATAPEARQRLHEAMARAETARRAMVDPAIEKYRAATAGELAAYNTFLAALAPGEDHTPGLERFRSATAPALAELRAVEAEAHAAYHAVVRPIEAELAGLIGPVEQWPRGAVAANALADALGLD